MTSLADHIPVLETDRLRLAAHSRDSWPAYRGIMTSDRAEFMDGALSDLDAWNAYICEAGSWVLDGFGYWTATEKTSATPVAFLGITHPPHFPETEIGWMTTAECEGRGFAFEAANAILDWAFLIHQLPTLVSYIDRENARSIALAERLGATRDDAAQAPGEDDLVYRHPRRAA